MFPSYPSLTCPHLLSSHLIFHILPLFIFFISTFFSYFLLSSPWLIIRTCGKHRRTCLGIWINHGACVLEAFCAPCFYLCLSVCLLFFFSLMNIHPVSPLSSLSLSFSNLHIFFFPVRLSPYLSPPSSLHYLSLLTSDEFTASQETHHPPTVLSDWTPKPQNFGIKIQFVLTWARGVYAIIALLY